MGKNKAKKNKVHYASTSEQQEIRNLCIVIIVVLLCVGGIYLLTRIFVTKDLFNNTETEEEVVAGTINYDVAIMGQILNRPYNEYYVAIYNGDDADYSGDMGLLIANYTKQDDHLHIYTVNLANAMNVDFYDPDNVNTKAQSLDELKVGDITLLKIKKGKITKFIVDYAKMQKELGIEES